VKKVFNLSANNHLFGNFSSYANMNKNEEFSLTVIYTFKINDLHDHGR